jgi:TetR/AcrR family transcriptional regulator, transcriptional repressor for nem operon
MARPRSQTKDAVIDRAMHCFWRQGFEATSIDALVRAIGISRYSLYGDFGGKEGLFVACLDAYRRKIVTPAFSQVEEREATLDAVASFFEFQISRGDEMGLPGPGCLMANVLTEVAPHNASIAAIVDAHNGRLHAGFRSALVNAAASRNISLKKPEADCLATILVVFANGLWSMSRAVTTAAPLRSAVREQLRLIEQRIVI